MRQKGKELLQIQSYHLLSKRVNSNLSNTVFFLIVFATSKHSQIPSSAPYIPFKFCLWKAEGRGTIIFKFPIWQKEHFQHWIQKMSICKYVCLCQILFGGKTHPSVNMVWEYWQISLLFFFLLFQNSLIESDMVCSWDLFWRRGGEDEVMPFPLLFLP